MSPERDAERLVAVAIAAAIRRARGLVLLEALTWGLAAAVISPRAGALIAVVSALLGLTG